MKPAGGCDSERGAATVLVVAFSGLLVLVAGALAVVGGLVSAHRAAQSAADLAALAGASAIADGHDGCAAADEIAEANDAVLVDCVIDGRDVRVRVEITGPRWLDQRGDLLAEARAGPG